MGASQSSESTGAISSTPMSARHGGNGTVGGDVPGLSEMDRVDSSTSLAIAAVAAEEVRRRSNSQNRQTAAQSSSSSSSSSSQPSSSSAVGGAGGGAAATRSSDPTTTDDEEDADLPTAFSYTDTTTSATTSKDPAHATLTFHLGPRVTHLSRSTFMIVDILPTTPSSTHSSTMVSSFPLPSPGVIAFQSAQAMAHESQHILQATVAAQQQQHAHPQPQQQHHVRTDSLSGTLPVPSNMSTPAVMPRSTLVTRTPVNLASPIIIPVAPTNVPIVPLSMDSHPMTSLSSTPGSSSASFTSSALSASAPSSASAAAAVAAPADPSSLHVLQQAQQQLQHLQAQQQQLAQQQHALQLLIQQQALQQHQHQQQSQQSSGRNSLSSLPVTHAPPSVTASPGGSRSSTSSSSSSSSLPVFIRSPSMPRPVGAPVVNQNTMALMSPIHMPIDLVTVAATTASTVSNGTIAVPVTPTRTRVPPRSSSPTPGSSGGGGGSGSGYGGSYDAAPSGLASPRMPRVGFSKSQSLESAPVVVDSTAAAATAAAPAPAMYVMTPPIGLASPQLGAQFAATFAAGGGSVSSMPPMPSSLVPSPQRQPSDAHATVPVLVSGGGSNSNKSNTTSNGSASAAVAAPADSVTTSPTTTTSSATPTRPRMTSHLSHFDQSRVPVLPREVLSDSVWTAILEWAAPLLASPSIATPLQCEPRELVVLVSFVSNSSELVDILRQRQRERQQKRREEALRKSQQPQSPSAKQSSAAADESQSQLVISSVPTAAVPSTSPIPFDLAKRLLVVDRALSALRLSFVPGRVQEDVFFHEYFTFLLDVLCEYLDTSNDDAAQQQQ